MHIDSLPWIPLSHRPLLPGWIPFVDPSLGSVHTYSHSLRLHPLNWGSGKPRQGPPRQRSRGSFDGARAETRLILFRETALKEAEESGSTGRADLCWPESCLHSWGLMSREHPYEVRSGMWKGLGQCESGWWAEALKPGCLGLKAVSIILS